MPEPGTGQLLPKIHACGVCRSDLHVADADLIQPKLPLIRGPAGSVRFWRRQRSERSWSFGMPLNLLIWPLGAPGR